MDRVLVLVGTALLIAVVCGVALFTDLLTWGYGGEVRRYWRQFQEHRRMRKR